MEGFYELKKFGFDFRDFGFGGNHVHFQVNVPKKYSVQDAETMLKSWSAKYIFEKHPDFRRRYPGGSFWSGYEHHESTGRKNLDEVCIYVIKKDTTIYVQLHRLWDDNKGSWLSRALKRDWHGGIGDSKNSSAQQHIR